MPESTLFPSITPDSDAERDVIDDLLDGGEPDTATVAELRNADACPFCADYDGEHVLQHASSAHADRVRGADADDGAEA